ncbi:transposase, partial [Salmonella enterica]|nr:transposase [Salmonella enterica]
MYVVAKELIGVKGMPATIKGVRQALQRFSDGVPDATHRRQGSKAVEYHISVLPPETRAAYLKQHNQLETSHGLIALPEKTQVTSERAFLWQCWDRASDEQRNRAIERVNPVKLMDELIDSGMKVREA